MRKNMPYMVLDITKKPGDPNAVKTGEMLLAENTKLREAVKAVVDVGYPHNFQHEAPHIRGYCYDITKAIKKCFDALATEKEGGAK